MSFVLENAPQKFQSKIDGIFKNENIYYYLVYINDIFILSKTLKQYKIDVKIVIGKLIKFGIVLRRGKHTYIEQKKNRIFNIRTRGSKNNTTKTYIRKKIKKFPEDMEGRK